MRNIFRFYKINLNKYSFLSVLGLVSSIALLNYLINVFRFRGYDERTGMVQMSQLLLNSSHSIPGIILIFIFPIIAAIPAGITYLDDTISGMNYYYISKIGPKQYTVSRLMAGFLTGFTAFFIPMFTEYLLSLVSFPVNATGNFYGISYLQPAYLSEIDTYLWKDFYLDHPCLYIAVFIVLTAFTAGLLNVITIAVSVLIRVRYRLFLILPSYLVLFLTNMIGTVMHFRFSTGYSHYLSAFGEINRNADYLTVLIAGMTVAAILLSLGGIYKNAKEY